MKNKKRVTIINYYNTDSILHTTRLEMELPLRERLKFLFHKVTNVIVDYPVFNNYYERKTEEFGGNDGTEGDNTKTV